ncbi:CBS domain-containing protein [Archaeoglobus sp.]
MRVKDVMRKNLIVVDEKTKIREVIEIMGKNRVGSVLVSKNGLIYGIFTERDLVSRVLLNGSLDDEVGKYASHPLIAVPPDYSIREVARVMACMNIRRIAVTENGKVVGILTSSDLVRLMGEKPLDACEVRCSICGRCLSRYEWTICTVCKRVVCLNCSKYELVRDLCEEDLRELSDEELKLKPMKAFPICVECHSHQEQRK